MPVLLTQRLALREMTIDDLDDLARLLVRSGRDAALPSTQDPH